LRLHVVSFFASSDNAEELVNLGFTKSSTIPKVIKHGSGRGLAEHGVPLPAMKKT